MDGAQEQGSPRAVPLGHDQPQHGRPSHSSTSPQLRSTSLEGGPLSGLIKDVVVIKASQTAGIDFNADYPGATLFHCDQQTHMDFGFMMLFAYR